jgi:O-antigen/teichoic acid export membrane protein
MNIKNIIHFSIGPIGSAFIGFISLPIITWIFTVEDVGRFAIFQVVISFSILFLTLGLDQAYVREYHSQLDKVSLFKTSILPGFFCFLIIVSLILISQWSLAFTLFNDDSSLLAFYLISAIILNFMIRYLSLILRMEEKGLIYSMCQLLPKVIFLSILISFYLFQIDLNFELLILANLVSTFFVFLISAYYTRNTWLSWNDGIVEQIKLKGMLNYSFPLLASGIAFAGLVGVDRFFLKSMSTLEELAIFSVAVSFAGVAIVFQSIFSTIWAPVVYRWVAEGVKQNKIQRVINLVTFFMLAIWAAVGIFAWIIPFILPEKYESVQHIIISSIAYPVLYTVTEATSIGVNVMRKTIFALIATIVALIVNIVLNYYLIPTYGALGASLSSAVAFFIYFVLRTYYSFDVYIWFSYTKAWLLIPAFTVASFITITSFVGIVCYLYCFLLLLLMLAYKSELKMYYRLYRLYRLK